MGDKLKGAGPASDKPFVVGVISSPHPHTRSHMGTLNELHEVEAVHLCGIEGEDVDALAGGSSKVRSITRSVEDLLSRRELDALLVCVRNDLCPEVLETAIRAGVPAMFEKPGALRSSDLRGVADSARQRGITLGAMLQSRWIPQVQEIRKARRDGALGRVMGAEARIVTSQVKVRDPSHWLFRRDTAGSGILSWLGLPHLDMLEFMLDDRIVEVTALVGSQNPERIEVEDTACVAFRFSGGALGTLHSGYHLAGSRLGYSGGSYDDFLAVRGTDGYARIVFSEGRPEAEECTVLSTAPGWVAGGRRELRFQPPESSAYAGVAGREFFSAFLQAARAGGPAPGPIEDCVHLLEVVEAALKSSTTARAVRVGETTAGGQVKE